MALPIPPAPTAPALPIPCSLGGAVVVPTLPSPFTFGVPIPEFDFDLTLCCKILKFAELLPPIPPIALPPGTINPGVIATVNEAITAVNEAMNAQTFDCPLEPPPE